MNKQKFLQALQTNCIFDNSEDKISLINYYDEVINNLIDSGLEEEEAVGTFNLDEIIRVCNLSKKDSNSILNYNLKKRLKNIKKDLKFYSIASTTFLLIPMILVLILTYKRYFIYRTPYFLHHGEKLFITWGSVAFFGNFFLLMTIHLNSKMMTCFKIRSKKIGILQILLLISIYFFAAAISCGFILLIGYGQYLVVLLLIFALLTPFIYFICQIKKLTKQINYKKVQK